MAEVRESGRPLAGPINATSLPEALTNRVFSVMLTFRVPGLRVAVQDPATDADFYRSPTEMAVWLCAFRAGHYPMQSAGGSRCWHTA